MGAARQQKAQLAKVTSMQSFPSGNEAVTVRIARSEADIHFYADAATAETVLWILKSF